MRAANSAHLRLGALALTTVLAALGWEASSGMIRHWRAPCGWASGQTSPPGPQQSTGWAGRDAAPEGTVLGSRVKILSDCRVLRRPAQGICWPFHPHLTGKIYSGKHLSVCRLHFGTPVVVKILQRS